MESLLTELQEIQEELQSVLALAAEASARETLVALEERAFDIGRAHSGAWKGKDAYKYWKDLEIPPNGTRFYVENGSWRFASSDANWVEYSTEYVHNRIRGAVTDQDFANAKRIGECCRLIFEDKQSEVVSVFETSAHSNFGASLFERMTESRNLRNRSIDRIIAEYKPDDLRDYTLMTGISLSHHRVRTPPHFTMLAEVLRLSDAVSNLSKLNDIVEKAIRHMHRTSRSTGGEMIIGNKIFIGHGHSLVWRELKDFLQDRLNLTCDDFDRVSPAGLPITGRLSRMLDSAIFAFLVMTAEDEQPDGEWHPRMNVIHEAGLFQGRLGFDKAIILLEENCKEFSNIHGLVQIRFPKDDISARFEEVRQVLEDRGILAR